MNTTPAEPSNSNTMLQNDNENDEQLMKKIRFRNYRPRSESLKKCTFTSSCLEARGYSWLTRLLTRIDSIDMEETDAANKEWENWESEFDAEMADAEHKFANPDTDLQILAPKKINWDLKMEFEPKARLLQRQTHKALLEIVREKVANATTSDAAAGGGGVQGERLARAVAQAQNVASDDDDDEDGDEL